MTKKKLINSLKTFFTNSANHYSLKMAFLYGSWAGDCAKDDSDIDIAIVCAETLSEDEAFENITDISVKLFEKFGVEVSLLHIHQDFLEPMLYYNAIVLGEPIFFSDFTEYVDLRNYAIYQMEDFSIFGIDWQISVAEKNLMELKRV